ncbi:unnamed protein product [Notodromas monacha]|uniref:ER membrane protein complex subunit 4 n=1 Tax=Notodromas monacha TaxID=399045 RepID=A0A7R9BF34_9CRUS|nr:unnamed protein product [Notodromas monacha]CAG0912948.1 unnamed protein product [Notodromas monacha]
MAGKVHGGKRSRWAIDFVTHRESVYSNISSPPGFSTSTVIAEGHSASGSERVDQNLVIKRSWDLALGPLKQLPMNMFIMYMAGNSISIFPIMMVGMLFLRPVKAILGIQSTFSVIEGSHAVWQKIVFFIGNVACILMALWKCQSMGLLPTHASDWLAFIEPKERAEFAFGGIALALPKDSVCVQKLLSSCKKMSVDSGIVLVTGATGFLATHCIKLLQERGWQVRGTVRNKNDEKKNSALYGLVPDAKHKLELVEADLTKPATWPDPAFPSRSFKAIPPFSSTAAFTAATLAPILAAVKAAVDENGGIALNDLEATLRKNANAVKGCTYVLHVASPFPGSGGKVRDVENQLMRPAVEGTLNVLRACAKAGTVKRVVVTSSVASIFSDTKHKDGERKYNEEDWTDMDDPHCDKYCVSKTKAEKAAWDYVKGLSDSEKFELVTICPSFINGPLLTSIHNDATSLEPVVLLMNRDLRLIGGVPHYMFPICDARDVGLRLLAKNFGKYGYKFPWLEIPTIASWFARFLDSNLLAKNFGKYGYKFPWLEIPTIASWFARFLDSNVKHYVYPRLGLRTDYDNTKLQTLLKIKPRPVEETLVDMGRSMVALGYARKLRPFDE